MEGEGLLGGGKGEGGKCDALLRPTLRHSIYITALTLSILADTATPDMIT
jgi:hypothetical protein